MKLDLKEWINKVTDMFHAPFTLGTVTITYGTIAMTAQGTKAIPTVAKYEPLCVAGWANGGSTQFYPYEIHLSGNNVICNVRNYYSSQLTGCSITVYILYRYVGG